jgi:hypothetical protein
MFADVSALGALTLAGTPGTLALPATWCAVESFGELWLPGPQRRDRELLPHVKGRRTTHVYQDDAEYPLRLLVSSTVLHDAGSTTGMSSLSVVRENVRHLAAFCAPQDSGVPVELAAVYEQDGEPDGSATVTCELLGLTVTPDWGRVTLVVHVDDGEFIEAGS